MIGCGVTASPRVSALDYAVVRRSMLASELHVCVGRVGLRRDGAGGEV